MKKKIHPFWLALSVLLSVAALALCVIAGRGGVLYLQPNGEAQDTAAAFFNAVVAGDYPRAYACLSDYSGLGLENVPENETDRALCDALHQSYGFRLSGPCEVDRLTAVQPVELRYLDLKAVEREIAARVGGIAEELVAERPAPEIYDEEGAYLASFTDELYATALRQVLENAEEYYSTAFHELTHSTGAKHRLDRLDTGKAAAFGSESYSKEELIAELGAAMLVNHCGIETEKSFKNSAGYIQGWLRALNNDQRLIVSASSKAEKAVEYILTGRKGEVA